MGVWAMDETSSGICRSTADRSASSSPGSAAVLIVQGEEDTSVYPDNAERLLEARKESALPTEIVLFPGLQHFYKKVPAGLDPMAAFGLETESDPAVAAAISAWLVKLAAH
jgi:fermentation-respiration switch protein FrsA (DUF1100 family)